MKILANFDFNQNEIQNAAIQRLATAPTSPTPIKGQLYFNTTLNRLFCYNGTGWIGADALGATMTGDDIVTAINASTSTIDLDNIDSISTASILGRKTASTGVIEILTKTDVLTLLNVADGANAYTHPNHSGDVTSTGDGATTIANKAVTLAKMADMATASFLGRNAAETGAPEVLSVATVKTMLDLPSSSAADIESAVSLKHSQNTDLGTSSSTFYIGTGGPKIKNSTGEVQLRNAGDTDYADLRIKNLVVEGTTTTINSETIDLADNKLLLNSNITTAAGNENGGIAVKRLMVDNITRKDAELYYDVSNERWVSIQGDVSGTLTTTTIANKYTTTIGDGEETSFTVTHNLGTRDCSVTVRETGGDYAVILTDVAMATTNTVTVAFAVAPTSNQYTVTVIG